MRMEDLRSSSFMKEVQKIRKELFTNAIQWGIRHDEIEFVPEVQGRFNIRKLLPCITFTY